MIDDRYDDEQAVFTELHRAAIAFLGSIKKSIREQEAEELTRTAVVDDRDIVFIVLHTLISDLYSNTKSLSPTALYSHMISAAGDISQGQSIFFANDKTPTDKEES